MTMHSKSDHKNAVTAAADEETKNNSCSAGGDLPGDAAAATVASVTAAPPTRKKMLSNNKTSSSVTTAPRPSPSSVTASADGGSSVIVDNAFLHMFLPDRPGGVASLMDEKNRLFKSGSKGLSSNNNSASSSGGGSALVFLNSHPSAPMTLGWHSQVESELIFPTSSSSKKQQQPPTTNVENADPYRRHPEVIRAMNRNARRGRKANHGKRPCSRIARRTKSRAIGRHRRG
jgi:hypothetical protein